MRECYSPEFRSMNKDSTSFRNSGAYTSPGSPDYRDNHGGGFQKGWCSERVPMPTSSNRRRASASATANVFMPFNHGRTCPSKWDDAERWITSPVSGSGFCKALAPPPQRRPKSKSGPLGEATYFSNYSPALLFLEGGTGSSNNFLAGSPLTTGVLVPNGLSLHHKPRPVPAHTSHRVPPSASGSGPEWSELLIESSFPDSQDENNDENGVTRVISRRDMATQMSPVDSPLSSPSRRPPLSTSPPIPSPGKPCTHHSARVDVRDVQVDKGITMRKQPKRHTRRMEQNGGSTEIKSLDLTWDPTEGAIELSKLQKEEARIAAWENLQNAKAEASIRKLEMKLEKKKSASMERIMKKLRVAHMKAQEMRKTSGTGTGGSQGPRTCMSLHRYAKIPLISCFGCHHS